jgi:hypothetical protein
MELHGTLRDNLKAALSSVRRLRGHPVHADTVQHWSELLHHTRRQLAGENCQDREQVEALALELQVAIVERG